MQFWQSPAAANPLPGWLPSATSIAERAQHAALMSSTATWPPGPTQSTEAEPGNNSAIPARMIATWLQNRAADFLDSPFIRVYRTIDVKGSTRRLQGKGGPPRLSRLTFQDACRGLLRIRPCRTDRDKDDRHRYRTQRVAQDAEIGQAQADRKLEFQGQTPAGPGPASFRGRLAARRPHQTPGSSRGLPGWWSRNRSVLTFRRSGQPQTS